MQAVEDITDALDRRDLDAARKTFDHAVQDCPDTVVDVLLRLLAATVTIPDNTVVYGFGIDVWANPHRHDYAWRCGSPDCRWTGSNYESMAAAQSAAAKHAAEHPTPPTLVKYGSEPYAAAGRPERVDPPAPAPDGAGAGAGAVLSSSVLRIDRKASSSREPPAVGIRADDWPVLAKVEATAPVPPKLTVVFGGREADGPTIGEADDSGPAVIRVVDHQPTTS